MRRGPVLHARFVLAGISVAPMEVFDERPLAPAAKLLDRELHFGPGKSLTLTLLIERERALECLPAQSPLESSPLA